VTESSTSEYQFWSILKMILVAIICGAQVYFIVKLFTKGKTPGRSQF